MSAASPVEKSASILVVDDDESNRQSLSRRLERRGYSVSVAVDGKDALAQVSTGPFDLIILDVMMPGINGMEVLATVRKTYSKNQLPIIMATARDQSEDVVAALDNGANDYVTKPLDFAVVSARVRTHLDLKQSFDQILALEKSLVDRNNELNAANLQLTANAAQTARELNAAAMVQKAFLPQANPPVTGAKFAWVFEPCTELAGDSLNIMQLDDNNVALYVLDVSGHGVAASLLAVTVTRLLSPSASGDSLVLQIGSDGLKHAAEPTEVATRLAQTFSIDDTQQFITLFYAVYNAATREMKYVSAGHPGAIRVRQGQPPCILHGTGQPIGIGKTYEQHSIHLNDADRLYLYSDGVTEAMDPNRALFGTDRLLQNLDAGGGKSLSDSIASLLETIQGWQAGSASRDDISILGMECL